MALWGLGLWRSLSQERLYGTEAVLLLPLCGGVVIKKCNILGAYILAHPLLFGQCPMVDALARFSAVRRVFP